MTNFRNDGGAVSPGDDSPSKIPENVTSQNPTYKGSIVPTARDSSTHTEEPSLYKGFGLGLLDYEDAEWLLDSDFDPIPTENGLIISRAGYERLLRLSGICRVQEEPNE